MASALNTVFEQRRKDLREDRLQPSIEHYDEAFIEFLAASPTSDIWDEVLYEEAFGRVRVACDYTPVTCEKLRMALHNDLPEKTVVESFKISSDKDFRQIVITLAGPPSSRLPTFIIIKHVPFRCLWTWARCSFNLSHRG